jgi:uncharacterized membrane-anchored protein YitT (DUF2179 family)
MTTKKITSIVKPYIFITFGLLLFSFSVTSFLIPAEIISGGISGLAALIYFATGIPVGYPNLLMNVVLVIVAMRILGAKFGVNTIYGILVTSFFLIVLQKIMPGQIIKDQFMSALLGGILSGAGIGIAFSHGGNSGGTDIIALIVTKYRNISPGRVILYCDVIIITSSFLIFRSIEKIVYGYVVMAVFSYTLDLILEGAKQSYQFTIISEDYQRIADRISTEVGRGVTALKGKGWYNKTEKEVLIVIIRKHDQHQVLQIIQECDKNAFISVAKVTAVFGENFDTIRL